MTYSSDIAVSLLMYDEICLKIINTFNCVYKTVDLAVFPKFGVNHCETTASGAGRVVPASINVMFNMFNIVLFSEVCLRI